MVRACGSQIYSLKPAQAQAHLRHLSNARWPDRVLLRARVLIAGRHPGGNQWSSQLDPRSDLYRLRCPPPGWIPGGVASVVNGGELSTEALQGREEPDLGWVMRHGAAPPE